MKFTKGIVPSGICGTLLSPVIITMVRSDKLMTDAEGSVSKVPLLYSTLVEAWGGGMLNPPLPIPSLAFKFSM